MVPISIAFGDWISRCQGDLIPVSFIVALFGSVRTYAVALSAHSRPIILPGCLLRNRDPMNTVRTSTTGQPRTVQSMRCLKFPCIRMRMT